MEKLEELEKVLTRVLSSYDGLINSMEAINSREGYKFTQILINHSQKLKKFKEEANSVFTGSTMGFFSNGVNHKQSFPRVIKEESHCVCVGFYQPSHCPVHGIKAKYK